MSLWLLFLLALLIVAVVLAILIYSGLFHPIDVKVGKPPIGGFVGYYKFRTGPYKNCCKIFKEVDKLVPEHDCFGVYYDDPKAVESSKLRWAVGACFSKQSKETEAVQKLLSENGFKKFDFPVVSTAMRVDFPIKNRLSLFIAIYRVYAKMARYAQDHNLNEKVYLEYYPEGMVHFFAPLEKQDQFFVPEALTENKK